MYGCTSVPVDRMFDKGISYELASYRKSILSNVEYNLLFEIPDALEGEISGKAEIIFETNGRVRKPLLLDFMVSSDYLYELIVNGKNLSVEIIDEHIVIPPGNINSGLNTINIKYRAGEMSLNRNQDYLYTLLVPDRASTLFPCFDQPDIKARFRLSLSIPSEYEAMSNNPVSSDTTEGDIRRISFEEGHPISTYLFAFAAGKFKRVEKEVEGVMMEMLHRETSEETIERNIDALFRLHYDAITWMENYTDIPYPFSKFGFVLIPSFQYGGMEHPGSIFYRASSLFLEENPTINEQLSRASLIAHETSHIWFGDLVTMKWFDDVWLKEVFAGYMADKIVNPGFPGANHDLRFLLSRYPAAYAVDRTRGANPIIQSLDNLRNAGSLYGGIIYNKAPVVMKHLELITGDSLLRESLGVYLDRFSYGNAEWDDLVDIIENVSGKELREWSNAWVREPGMPRVESRVETKDGVFRVWFDETDPGNLGRHWPQTLKALIVTGHERLSGSPVPGDRENLITLLSKPEYIIPDTTGTAYGYFVFDSSTVEWFSHGGANSISDPLIRGTVWLNAYENLLNGNIKPAGFYENVLQSALSEEDEQLRNFLMSRLTGVFWNHLSNEERWRYAAEGEKLVLDKIKKQTDASQRRSWFNLYRSFAVTEEGLAYLY
ncbi:MAG: hypothetical protein IH591_15330, partial [Bacteroidales bacterium]|nr:hypothetical protein [Bacteroidales bacterium]